MCLLMCPLTFKTSLAVLPHNASEIISRSRRSATRQWATYGRCRMARCAVSPPSPTTFTRQINAPHDGAGTVLTVFSLKTLGHGNPPLLSRPSRPPHEEDPVDHLRGRPGGRALVPRPGFGHQVPPLLTRNGLRDFRPWALQSLRLHPLDVLPTILVCETHLGPGGLLHRNPEQVDFDQRVEAPCAVRGPIANLHSTIMSLTDRSWLDQAAAATPANTRPLGNALA